MHVVGPHPGEQLPLLLAILPVFELPVLSIYKHSHYTLPARLSEVGDAVVDVEGHLFVSDAPSDLDNLGALVVDDEIFAACVTLLIVYALFKEILNIVQSNIARY